MSDWDYIQPGIPLVLHAQQIPTFVASESQMEHHNSYQYNQPRPTNHASEQQPVKLVQ